MLRHQFASPIISNGMLLIPQTWRDRELEDEGTEGLEGVHEVLGPGVIEEVQAAKSQPFCESLESF